MNTPAHVEIRKNTYEMARKKLEEALRANDNYCPCKTEKIPENKCICKEFREQTTSGWCTCGLYEKLVFAE